MSIQDIKVDADFLQRIVQGRQFNEVIIDYYNQLYDEFPNELFLYKAERMGECNQFWQLDRYTEHKVKDYKKTNLCRDKFCYNCKKVKQSARMEKFMPYLEKYKDCLCHLVLTVPSVKGDDLKKTIKRMLKALSYLIKYLAGNKKIAGVDLSYLGYEGALRSLETTYKGDMYHPHLHVALVLHTELSERNIINKYSYHCEYGMYTLKRIFCKEEILIQKMWRLLFDEVRLTKENIDNLEEGYSCILDKFQENDYAELFKYMTKEVGMDSKVITYNQFKTLYFSLHSVRQIQGYGCLYNIKDSALEDIMEESDRIYEDLIMEMQKKETPKMVLETPQELLRDNEFTVISRKRIYKRLKQLYQLDA